MVDTTDQLIDPDHPSFGRRFDTNRDKFSVYQAAMLWTGREPAEDGMFRDADERRIRLNLGGNRCDPYQVNRSVFYALVDAIDRNEFDIIPIRMKSGEVDDSATLIPRDQLIAWAKVREEAPSFLFAAMVNPQASDAVPAPIDISLLATRRQLIAAFGSFTGMDMSWFKHLRDTPQLK